MNSWGLTPGEREFLKIGAQEEGMPLLRWSSFGIPDSGAVPNEIQFYGDIQQNVGPWFTNMREPNKIEKPYRVVFKRLYVKITRIPKALAHATETQAALEFEAALREAFVYKTGIIDKSYTEYPSDMIPEGTSVTGAFSTDDALTGGWAGAGVPALGNYMPISLPLEYATTFYLTANLAREFAAIPLVAPAAPTPAMYYIRAYLNGPCVRNG